MRKFKLIRITLILGAFTFFAFSSVKASSTWIEDADGYYYYNLDSIDPGGAYSIINLDDYEKLEYYNGYIWSISGEYSSITIWISTENNKYVLNMQMLAGHLYDNITFEYDTLNDLRAAKVLRVLDYSEWILKSDGFYYYIMPSIQLEETIEITIEENEIFSIYSYTSKSWHEVDDGVLELTLKAAPEYGTGFKALWYLYGDLHASIIDVLAPSESTPSQVVRKTGEYPASPTGWQFDPDGYYYYYFEPMQPGQSINFYKESDEILEYFSLDTQEWHNLDLYSNKDFDGIKLTLMNTAGNVTLYGQTFRVMPNPYDFLFEIEEFDKDYINDFYTPGKVIRKVNQFEIPGENITNVNDLPITANNRLGTVLFEVDGLNVKIQISYNSRVYYINRSFDINTDMSIFTTIEAYFMNIDGNPQIIINNSDRPYLRDILEAPENQTPAFVPHTIWDLLTNELEIVSSYKTNVYIKQTAKGPIVSYVYIDEFIIDNMISAHLSWADRQKNGFPYSLIFGKYTDWEIHEDIFVNDEYLEYKNLTSNWENFIPGWNIIRGIYQLTKTYEMPRIDNVNWSNIQPEYNITKTEVETYFRNTNPDFETFNSNPRYKLWAFGLQGGKSYMGTQTEIYHNPDDLDDPMNFKIIQLVYITNGQLYEAVGNDMDLIIVLDPKIDGIANENNTDWIKVIIIVAVLLGWIMVLNGNQGFKKMQNFIRITLIYAGVILAILILYQYVIAPELFIRL